jgi:hypothetical protein
LFGLFKKKNKHVFVGIGHSEEQDAYLCAKAAVQAAKAQLEGEPTFSIVYVDSKFDPHQVTKSVNELLGTNWVGCSTDSQNLSDVGYFKGGIAVVSIRSENLHFGVGYAENYKKDAEATAKKALKTAMSKVKIDKQVDPYVQFRRLQTKSFEDIIKTPPYFILTFLTGVEMVKGKQIAGYETEFIEGVKDVLGVNVPIVGGSVSSDLDTFMKGQTNLFMMAEGKVLEHAAIVIFVVSNLYFALNVDNGYKNVNRIGIVTGVDKTGHLIETINSEPALDTYAKLLGVPKEDVLKNPFKYTFEHPLGVMKDHGHLFIKEWMPGEDGRSIRVLNKVRQNSVVSIVDVDKAKTVDTIHYCLKEINTFVKEKNPALVLIFNCCGRKPLLGKDLPKEMKLVARSNKNVPMVGFHTFGEIGAKHDSPAETVNQSAALLIIYDRLLTE